MDKIANKRRYLPFYPQCEIWMNLMWIKRHFNANLTVLSTIRLISLSKVLVLILTQLFKIVSDNIQVRVRHLPEEEIG